MSAEAIERRRDLLRGVVAAVVIAQWVAFGLPWLAVETYEDRQESSGLALMFESLGELSGPHPVFAGASLLAAVGTVVGLAMLTAAVVRPERRRWTLARGAAVAVVAAHWLVVVFGFSTNLDEAQLRFGAGLFVSLVLWLVAIRLTAAARSAAPRTAR